MADAQEQYSEFLDFEDFIAIIIEEMLIYRQYFGQFQTSNQMHYTRLSQARTAQRRSKDLP